jgi:Anti-sigma-28 factor, FlgM
VSVVELKARIERGEYVVDADAVAEAFLDRIAAHRVARLAQGREAFADLTIVRSNTNDA